MDGSTAKEPHKKLYKNPVLFYFTGKRAIFGDNYFNTKELDQLMDGVICGKLRFVKSSLDLYPYMLNMKDDFGSTLLLYRTAHGGESFPGLEPMVKLLIDRGADVHVADDHGTTALINLAFGGNEKVFRMVYDKNADVNAKDKAGCTCLHGAASSASEGIVMLLLRKGAVVDAVDKDGVTPLMSVNFANAVITARDAVVKLLLDVGGARMDIKNKKGQTALSIAKAHGSLSTVHILESREQAQSGRVGEGAKVPLSTRKTHLTKEEKSVFEDYPDAKPSAAVPVRNETTPLHKSMDADNSVDGNADMQQQYIVPDTIDPLFNVPVKNIQSVNRGVTGEDDIVTATDLNSLVRHHVLPTIDQLVKLSNKLKKVTDYLVSNKGTMPNLVYFFAASKSQWEWLKNPAKSLFTTKMYMVFVCPVTFCVVPGCGPNGLGWEIDNPKKWVKKYGPAILISIEVLRAALALGKVLGVPLPTLPSNSSLCLGSSKDSIANQALASMQRVVYDIGVEGSMSWASDSISDSLETNCIHLDIDSMTAKAKVLRLSDSDAAYSAIYEMVTTQVKLPIAEQLKGKMERVVDDVHGDVEWVSVDGVEAWKESQRQKYASAVPLDTTPVVHNTTVCALTGVISADTNALSVIEPSGSSPGAGSDMDTYALMDDALSSWIKSALGKHATKADVISCHSAFHDDGIYTLELLERMDLDYFTKENLKSVGIKKTGHCISLADAFRKLLVVSSTLPSYIGSDSTDVVESGDVGVASAETVVFLQQEVASLKLQVWQQHQPNSNSSSARTAGGLTFAAEDEQLTSSGETFKDKLHRLEQMVLGLSVEAYANTRPVIEELIKDVNILKEER